MGSSVLKHWKVVTPQGLGPICGRSEFYVLFYWCVIVILWGGHYAVICRRRRPIYSSADWRANGGRASSARSDGIRACGGGGGIRTGGGGGGKRARGGGGGIRADRVCSVLPSICRSSTPVALEKNASFALLAAASNPSSDPCAAAEHSMNPFDGVTIGE